MYESQIYRQRLVYFGEVMNRKFYLSWVAP